MNSIKAKSPERNIQLDLLRGLAILGVVAVHTGTFTDSLVAANGGALASSLSYLFSLGKYGVELFFFISGWLLCSIYYHEGGGLQIPLSKYLKRRVGRIYPLWIAFMALGFLRSALWKSGNVYRIVHPENGNHAIVNSSLVILFATLTFTLWTSDILWNWVIPGGWSIQAEVGHYLLFPLMRRLSNKKVLKTALMVNILTSIAYLQLPRLVKLPSLINLPIKAWIRLDLFSTFGYFYLGILAAQLFLAYKKDYDIKNAFYSLKIPISTFSFWLGSFLLIPLSFGRQIEAIGFVFISLVCSFGFMEIQWLKQILSILGKYSYFIYFSHFIVLELIGIVLTKINFYPNFPMSQPITFSLVVFVTLSISLLLAMPSFKYFEHPLIRLSHR